jgi:group I intron endonuclease
MDKKYTVYMHISPSDKKYIGITSMEPKLRWNSGCGYSRKQIFGKAILKYGWQNFKHEILFNNLTIEEAEQKEKELINHYKTYDRNYGYNIELGGNVNKIISKESREKMSKAKKGKKPHNYGKHLSKEQKSHLSKINTGKTIPYEVREKISNNTIGSKNKKAIAVNQYTIDDVFIKKWDCMMDVERAMNISNSKVCAVCKGKRKSTGGYKWKYADFRS